MDINFSRNGFQNSFPNERSMATGGDVETATDPASSSFFSNDYKRHDDLKDMLDSNKDSLKLEAMKRIIGMIAKGKDASDLFPAVVKNVVSKNVEVKKLVYVYLTRYAEEQQDLALLSISTFQRALKDPNQLIRASALRVLSSIRVPMIVPIMMLAIKEAVMDMSPYVRKTAAHAIPKLYSLDDEQKDALIEVIEKLLGDKTTLVAGSAIQAFEEVCPERIDLIHKHYRKLCNLLADVEEWGQVVIINMLTRYARTQFLNPNLEENGESEPDQKFYDSSDSEADKKEVPKKTYTMDMDHRLLLRASKPLLNSRNAAVVMAVAQLYYHCAPKSEVNFVAKSLVRLLRSHKEVQYIVLSNIAAMTIQRKGMFEPYLKSFYVHSNDPTHVKLLKLEILTNLATETSISTILREFQTYVTSSDQEFAAATIHAIGRCASNISEITDTCLNGLVNLLSNRNENVVGESVVVIKKLLQMQPSGHKDIIVQMAKMTENIAVPMARASILWLIGEYSDRVPKIAPDVLRIMAKTFITEEDIVKLQILNLAAKLCITNPKQTKLLCQYVFSLAKYDQSYDIRDRARYLKALVLPGDQPSLLSKYAKKIFLCSKPAPVLQSRFKDRDQFQLGTLSHMINQAAVGYHDLPMWPEVAPDPKVRDIEITPAHVPSGRIGKKIKEKKSFYSESDGSTTTEGADSTASSEEEDDDENEEVSEEESSESEGEDTDSEEEEEEEEEEESSEDETNHAPIKSVVNTSFESPQRTTSKQEMHRPKLISETTESSEEESSEEESSEEESSEEEVVPVKKVPEKKKKIETKKKVSEKKKTDVVNLLDLDDFGPAAPAPTVTVPFSNTGVLQPMSGEVTSAMSAGSNFINPTTIHVQVEQPLRELLNRITGDGLYIQYRFTRTLSAFSPKFTSVELIFNNTLSKPLENIRLKDKKLPTGVEIDDFPIIPVVGGGSTISSYMSINFNDTTQAATFNIGVGDKQYSVNITAPVGELLVPNTLTDNDFKSLMGM
ncbi:DgyrCDS13770 [Dimorphilus gyrociliatus]|uniref:AP-3 complex subunit beta n=1 Tax=Dimorphilus gyrociliatus TaxID=2664684 RepID=A0A7I8WBQ8_9ANNE|nr:DgyrCDS13770 [Dimorphilus gyrociliatus]